AVDGAIKGTAKDTYAARQDKAAADKEAERAKEQLVAFEGLDELQAQLEAAEYILTQIDRQLVTVATLEKLTAELFAAKNGIEKAAAELDRLAVIPDLEEDLKDIEKAQQRYQRLLDLYEMLGRATATVENLTQQLTEYAGIEAAEYLLTKAEDRAATADNLIKLNSEYQKRNIEVNNSMKIISATKDMDVIAADLERIVQTQQRLTIMSNLSMEYAEAKEKVSKIY